MKRRIICIICLVCYILISCTLLSLKIEQEMLTQAEVMNVKGDPLWDQQVSISQAALFEDEDGIHLYELVDGSGWESGLRVQEIPWDGYELDHENGTVSLADIRDYCFITSASRQPVAGELVEVIDTKEEQQISDLFLFVYPQGVPEGALTAAGLSLQAQSENAVLAAIENTTASFLEHRQKSEYHALAGPGWRIFSMSAVGDFWEQLPLTALIAVLLLAVTVLWVFSFIVCVFAVHPKRLFFLAGAVSIASLAAICLILHHIDLPSAMLPDTNILNIRHYRSTFETMLSGLKTLPDPFVKFSALQDEVSSRCAAIGAVGFALTGITAIGEWFYIRRA